MMDKSTPSKGGKRVIKLWVTLDYNDEMKESDLSDQVGALHQPT